MSQSMVLQLCDLIHPELQELMQGSDHIAESNEHTGREAYIPDCCAIDTAMLPMQRPCSCTDGTACSCCQGPA